MQFDSSKAARLRIAARRRAAAWPLAARAQQATTVARIGYLGFGSAAASASWVEALRAGLHDLGYVEGKNIVIEFRWADRVEQLPELAAELVRMNVDVIFAPSSTMVEARPPGDQNDPHCVL
jgi:putative tryptophan/tyrosine transport system substrate-binding protein